jgi:CRISPR-associated protein Cmr6
MRAALPKPRLENDRCVGLPDHAGLAYEVWAPFSAEDGKIRLRKNRDGKSRDEKGGDEKSHDQDRSKWLEAITELEPSPDYPKAFARWEASFRQPGDLTVKVEAVSRLLVGHGNGSATDVGLTLHRTWGVPVIPGSALKGLLAHWVEATLGPADPSESDRLPFAGVEWDGRRILRGPGEVYRALFGAPEADEPVPGRPNLAARGLVTFHDALWVPDTPSGAPSPLAVDVLTVHQKPYYDEAGRKPPVDWADPNPVSFLSVRPGTRFLLALSGPPDWTAFAKGLLLRALDEWGVGGKTAAGYGRLVQVTNDDSASLPRVEARTVSTGPAEGDIVECILVDRVGSGQWRARYEARGLQGPIVNSNKVPKEAKPGDPVRLKLTKARGKDSRFEVP